MGEQYNPRDHFDETPQQYHHGLDILWAALPDGTKANGADTVYTLVRDRLSALEERNAALVADIRIAFAHVEGGGCECPKRFEGACAYCILRSALLPTPSEGGDE